MWNKNIPHSDCSETGAISKKLSKIAFLYEIYRENATFFTKFRIKKNELVKFLKMIFVWVLSLF